MKKMRISNSTISTVLISMKSEKKLLEGVGYVLAEIF